MWNELEAYVRCHCITAEHRSVLDCLLECRKPNTDGENSTSIASVKAQLGAHSPSHPSYKKLDKSKEEKMETSVPFEEETKVNDR